MATNPLDFCFYGSSHLTHVHTLYAPLAQEEFQKGQAPAQSFASSVVATDQCLLLVLDLLAQRLSAFSLSLKLAEQLLEHIGLSPFASCVQQPCQLLTEQCLLHHR